MLKFKWETEFKKTEIGEVPKEWEVKRIEQITKEAIVGSTPLRRKKEYWEKGTIPWLTNKEVQYNQINFIEDTEEKVTSYALERTNLKFIPPFSLIVSFTASVGKVAINKIPITTNQQFISFVLNDKEDVKFYAYYLLLSQELIESFSGATPFSFVTKEKALQIPIPLPPPTEQSRIATVLSWFDDLIENKKRQNDFLEKTAMTIFKSWFVDFKPFKDEEFVYNADLDREVPKGWEVKGLGIFTEIIMGQSPSSKYYNEQGEGLPFIQGKGQYGEYIPETTIYCSKFLKIAKPNDILVTVRAPVGELNLADREYIIGRGVASLRNKYWSFLFLYLLSDNERLKSYERGTTYDAITKEELDSFPLLLPPQPILEKFHSLVEPLFQKIILNQKQIMVLRKIRDALLSQLVFGKLRMEEI